MNVNSAPAAQIAVPQNTRIPQQSMDQGDFLNLLITQLANQNPLKPTDGNEMLQQMTQIASIQSMTSMQTAMKDMQTNQQLNMAQNLIGKMVEVYDADQGGDFIGTVNKVSVLNVTGSDGKQSQKVSMNVDGTEYPVTALVSILQQTQNP
jgi:flagellar basal-body rod modification protein FlgD